MNLPVGLKIDCQNINHAAARMLRIIGDVSQTKIAPHERPQFLSHERIDRNYDV
jgi:hypothetical protein